MDLSRVSTSLIGIVVLIIMVALVALPSISQAQNLVGDQVTYENETTNLMTYDNRLDDLHLELSDSSLKINGVVVTPPSGAVFASDKIFINFNGTSYYGSYIDLSAGYKNFVSFDIQIDNGIMSGTAVYEGNVTKTANNIFLEFGYYYSEDGDYARMASGPIYVNSSRDITAIGVSGTSFYCHHNGTTSGSGESEYVFHVTLTEVEGVTGVYIATDPTISIDGTNSVINALIVPIEVIGHEPSGTNYTLVGVIPLLLLIVPLFVVVNLIRGRSD